MYPFTVDALATPESAQRVRQEATPVNNPHRADLSGIVEKLTKARKVSNWKAISTSNIDNVGLYRIIQIPDPTITHGEPFDPDEYITIVNPKIFTVGRPRTGLVTEKCGSIGEPSFFPQRYEYAGIYGYIVELGTDRKYMLEQDQIVESFFHEVDHLNGLLISDCSVVSHFHSNKSHPFFGQINAALQNEWNDAQLIQDTHPYFGNKIVDFRDKDMWYYAKSTLHFVLQFHNSQPYFSVHPGKGNNALTCNCNPQTEYGYPISIVMPDSPRIRAMMQQIPSDITTDYAILRLPQDWSCLGKK